MKYELGRFISAIICLVEDGVSSSDDEAFTKLLTKGEFIDLALEAIDIVDPGSCALCQVDTYAIGEYYVVNDELWNEYGAGDNMLCIGCFERLLGRELTCLDFIDAEINTEDKMRSARLVDRLGICVR